MSVNSYKEVSESLETYKKLRKSASGVYYSKNLGFINRLKELFHFEKIHDHEENYQILLNELNIGFDANVQKKLRELSILTKWVTKKYSKLGGYAAIFAKCRKFEFHTNSSINNTRIDTFKEILKIDEENEADIAQILFFICRNGGLKIFSVS